MLAAQLEKYERSIELFEEIADAYVENDLLKFSCKEFYLKAGLCTLCSGDVEGAKVKVERFVTNSPHPLRFLLTREHWWGASTPLEGGSAHPISVLSSL